MKTHFDFKVSNCFGSRAVIVTLATVCVLVGAAPVSAQNVPEFSVILDGQMAVVRPDLDEGIPAEAVTFEHDAVTGRWIPVSDVDLSVQSKTSFSYAAVVSGDRAVVGIQWQDGFKGAAYVLRNESGTWVIEQRLSPDDLGRYDHFGSSVAVSDDIILIGAPWHDLFRGAACKSSTTMRHSPPKTNRYSPSVLPV
jgi:hypothetical protein